MKLFSVSDVLSATTGRLVSDRHMDEELEYELDPRTPCELYGHRYAYDNSMDEYDSCLDCGEKR